MGCKDSKAQEPKKINQPLTKALTNVKVSADIFISLKKGSISQFYRIGEIIGEGGFGCVRIGTHKQTGIKRAIKQLKKNKLIKEDEQQIISELEVLKDLDHPNILKIYDLYQDNKNYYLINEFLDGGELFERLIDENNFSEKLAATFMKQIFEAVHYCHQRNIVHRDLKLENLLFEEKNINSNLKIIDFGTSRKFLPDQKLTKRIGTPYYMAPEIFSREYNEKCDEWSCGVILYMLLCGNPPFDGDDNTIKRKIQEGKFSFPPSEWSSISESAKDLITKLLTKDPNERISVSEALQHAWIQDQAPSHAIQNNVLNNMKEFQSNSRWKNAISLFVATQVQQSQERQNVLKQFKSMDKNQDGTISKEELFGCYQEIDPMMDEQYLEDIFKQLDLNDSGKIDFSEFIVVSQKKEKLLNKEKLEKAFKMFDMDANGQISRNELQEIMGGVDVDEKQWNYILDECDKNKDGQISMGEFIEMMQQYNEV